MTPCEQANTTYQIIQGARTDSPSNPFVIKLKKDPITMDPFDLTAYTAITCCFLNADGTELMISLVSGISIVGNPLLGTLQIALTAAQTALLDIVRNATLELSLTISGDPIKCQIRSAYSVFESEC